MSTTATREDTIGDVQYKLKGKSADFVMLRTSDKREKVTEELCAVCEQLGLKIFKGDVEQQRARRVVIVTAVFERRTPSDRSIRTIRAILRKVLYNERIPQDLLPAPKSSKRRASGTPPQFVRHSTTQWPVVVD